MCAGFPEWRTERAPRTAHRFVRAVAGCCYEPKMSVQRLCISSTFKVRAAVGGNRTILASTTRRCSCRATIVHFVSNWDTCSPFSLDSSAPIYTDLFARPVEIFVLIFPPPLDLHDEELVPRPAEALYDIPILRRISFLMTVERKIASMPQLLQYFSGCGAAAAVCASKKQKQGEQSHDAAAYAKYKEAVSVA